MQVSMLIMYKTMGRGGGDKTQYAHVRSSANENFLCQKVQKNIRCLTALPDGMGRG